MKSEAKYVPLEVGKSYRLIHNPVLQELGIPLIITVTAFSNHSFDCEEFDRVHRSWVISEATELDKVLE